MPKAKTRKIAAHKLEAAEADLVITDVNMPEMDGLEASRAICARASNWQSSNKPKGR